jgi:hypothetical protein
MPAGVTVKNLFSYKPPSTLYHYTDQRGLLGILAARPEERFIRATQIQHLNDRNEAMHALGFATTTLRSWSEWWGKFDRDSDIPKRLEHIEASILAFKEVGIASFSSNGDLLSQWRAYGGSTGGYAIGFSGDDLHNLVAPDDVRLGQCIYEESRQKGVVVGLIREWSAYSGVGPVASAQTIALEWHRIAPLLKHPAFEAEQEWRLITGPMTGDKERLGFREGRTMIVPYLNVSLANVQIHEIVIGPTVQHDLSRNSVDMLLAARGLRTVTRLSDVPYKNW